MTDGAPDARILALAPHVCRTPRFAHQRVVDTSGVVALTPNCRLVVVDYVLSPDALAAYLAAAARVERRAGPSAYGHTKPRAEVCYHVEGAAPYAYSGRAHFARVYPAHVRALADVLLARCEAALPVGARPNAFRTLSHGVDILYSEDFERGGSIGAHSDDEIAGWGLVLIFSLGQTRWLRIRDKATKQWTNVSLRHNSLVAMHGADFQRLYTHQVDKLHEGEPVGARLSLNLRYGA